MFKSDRFLFSPIFFCLVALIGIFILAKWQTIPWVYNTICVLVGIPVFFGLRWLFYLIIKPKKTEDNG